MWEVSPGSSESLPAAIQTGNRRQATPGEPEEAAQCDDSPPGGRPTSTATARLHRGVGGYGAPVFVLPPRGRAWVHPAQPETFDSDEFVRFLPYCRQRLGDGPHLWASSLFDEMVELDYPGACATFTRALCAATRRDRTANRANAPAGGNTRSSSIRPVQSSNSIGSNCPTRHPPGAAGPAPT